MVAMHLDLSGKTALVTGSTQGIGEAIAVALARAGARTAVNGRRADVVDEAVARLREVAPGADVVGVAAVLGAGCLVLILMAQRWMPNVPGVLVAVILSIVAVRVFDLTGRGVDVVGAMPQGFPPLTFPTVPLHDLPLLMAGAVARSTRSASWRRRSPMRGSGRGCCASSSVASSTRTRSTPPSR